MDGHAEDTRPEPPAAPPGDDDIRALVARLSRPHRSGGKVIERASLLAAGSDFDAVIAWIEAHGGEAVAPAAAKGSGGGLYSARAEAQSATKVPLRYIVPAGALSAQA